MKLQRSLAFRSGTILGSLFPIVAVAAEAPAEKEADPPASRPAAPPRPSLPSIPMPDFSRLEAYDVVRVQAADHIVVRIGAREVPVRFLGVEAYAPPPDASVRAQAFSRQAARFLKNLLLGERIYMVADEEEGAGASAVYVHRAPDGLFVNAELVRSGFARAYSARPYRHRGAFIAYEQHAARHRKGQWALPTEPAGSSPTPPPSSRRTAPSARSARPQARPRGAAASNSQVPAAAERRVRTAPELLGDKQSFLYHGSVCRLRSRIVFPEQIDSARDAALKGYRPCRLCKPPR